MGIQEVKAYFKARNLGYEVLEYEASTATVELAAQALGVEPALIAKTMSFKLSDDNAILILSAGDKKIDNRKFKDTFKVRARMLSFDEVMEITGHPVGGVCPFGLKQELPVYLDLSLQEYVYVFPAAGSPQSAVKITPQELHDVTGGQWVNVCK